MVPGRAHRRQRQANVAFQPPGALVLADAVQPEIHQLIEAKDFATLKGTLREMEIHDLVELLLELEEEDLAVCFRLLPQDRAAESFGDLTVDQQERLLSTLSSERVTGILNDMPADDRTELLEELPGKLAQRLLNNLRGDQKKIATSLLAYPADSIGRLMTPDYIAVRPEWTCEKVLEHARKVAASKETLYVLYVVDSDWTLLDYVSLEDVLLAGAGTTVRDLMDEQVAYLTARDDQETAVELFRKYDALALPVVNSRGVLVGIVTHDDVLDVVQEEYTEDFQKMAALEPLQGTYFATSFAQMIRKRLPWLGLLLAGQTLTTIALIGFGEVPLFAVLVVFMPLINSPAGNTGSQVASLMIRGLAVQEITPADWVKVLGWEALRGLSLGAMLAMMGFLATTIFAAFVDTSPIGAMGIATSVSCAILAAVTLANLLGAMLPFVFHHIGLDPAVTSGPFLASVMDVMGIVIYFSIGMAMLAWGGG
jgi:magnesium transporter